MKTRLLFTILLAGVLTGFCGDTNSVAQYKTENFIGTWRAQTSEGDSATMQVELTLKSDGHFERNGIITSATKEKFTDQGTWRIDGDRFCTTMTNSTMSVIEKIKETRTPIVSVSKDQFIYKTSKRIWTWTKVQ